MSFARLQYLLTGPSSNRGTKSAEITIRSTVDVLREVPAYAIVEVERIIIILGNRVRALTRLIGHRNHRNFLLPHVP